MLVGSDQQFAGRAVELACALIAERGVGSRAVIRADARNPASARVLTRLGFVEEAEVIAYGTAVKFK